MVNMDLIILGTLMGHSAHGYAIKQAIEASFGKRYIGLSNSSLYPRLTKLEAGGFIMGKREQQEKVPDRRIFEITPAGVEHLKKMVAEPMKPRETDFDFKSKAVFFGLINPEERRRIIEPLYREKVEEVKEAREKREKFGALLDKYASMVMETGIKELEMAEEFYRKLLELE
ncbi:MAG TPA: PadR family transcriptional regulator [Methanocella sp.]|nr:PadR family transcriptional regulator [Methanocella sp.]